MSVLDGFVAYEERLVTRGDLVPQIGLATQSNSPDRHKNTTALRPDKFPITSTPLRVHTAIFGG